MTGLAFASMLVYVVSIVGAFIHERYVPGRGQVYTFFGIVIGATVAAIVLAILGSPTGNGRFAFTVVYLVGDLFAYMILLGVKPGWDRMKANRPKE